MHTWDKVEACFPCCTNLSLFFFMPLESFTLTAWELKNTVDVERT